MLFSAILTAFGKGQATTLFPKTRMLVLQTLNTDVMGKEALKEIRCLVFAVPGTRRGRVPAGCWDLQKPDSFSIPGISVKGRTLIPFYRQRN